MWNINKNIYLFRNYFNAIKGRTHTFARWVKIIIIHKMEWNQNVNDQIDSMPRKTSEWWKAGGTKENAKITTAMKPYTSRAAVDGLFDGSAHSLKHCLAQFYSVSSISSLDLLLPPLFHCSARFAHKMHQYFKLNAKPYDKLLTINCWLRDMKTLGVRIHIHRHTQNRWNKRTTFKRLIVKTLMKQDLLLARTMFTLYKQCTPYSCTHSHISIAIRCNVPIANGSLDNCAYVC